MVNSETTKVNLWVGGTIDVPSDHPMFKPKEELKAMIQTTDAASDRAYREGWMQAFREWSDCLRVTFPAIVAQADIDRMERRKQEMESYGKR